MAKVKTLYISNIHSGVTDDMLRFLFAQFGEVKNCVIVKNPATRESRGFAFVEYHVRQALSSLMSPHSNAYGL